MEMALDVMSGPRAPGQGEDENGGDGLIIRCGGRMGIVFRSLARDWLYSAGDKKASSNGIICVLQSIYRNSYLPT